MEVRVAVNADLRFGCTGLFKMKWILLPRSELPPAIAGFESTTGAVGSFLLFAAGVARRVGFAFEQREKTHAGHADGRGGEDRARHPLVTPIA